MNRTELADFLRRGRARLEPSVVGLTPGARRRTPGLRREEVASLAGMSVDYYTRLEQSRGPRPSRQMLTALARALRLTDDERDHLFHLAGEEPPRRESVSQHVRPGLLLILDRLHDTPAQVVTDCGEVLAQNAMACALSGDVSARPPRERNLVRRFFLDPAARAMVPPEDFAEHARAHVANLRAVAAARPDDPVPGALVAELRAGSPEFARLWESHEVAVRRTSTKRFVHPVVGVLELDCEIMVAHDHRQLLIVHTARPGTESYERLRLLRVVGVQDLSPTPTPPPGAAAPGPPLRP
ncbi:helix-turn-helix transcriptional regulator [Streptomyces turgidiscabies]|uniref:Transcriptional regulator with XRE-family HTH domain n=1 Tax=Streptomyces turgidiscabies TaxID=85558 RepID=A0ABU0RG78_9ACTN|nr:helix-turn-helix transcriptional regulator [Streptomyces turgidiscabies]MDQ0930994.1 transcriptional regulator with XRE-family HTH domain [Streptomyces turgidiscabies]